METMKRNVEQVAFCVPDTESGKDQITVDEDAATFTR